MTPYFEGSACKPNTSIDLWRMDRPSSGWVEEVTAAPLPPDMEGMLGTADDNDEDSPGDAAATHNENSGGCEQAWQTANEAG